VPTLVDEAGDAGDRDSQSEVLAVELQTVERHAL
jgi:hypothetical protein